MSRWLERLREISAPPPPGTDKTDRTPLVSVLAVTPEGGAALHADVAAPALAAVAWTDADIERFLAVRDRLLRWGWPESEAEDLADRAVEGRRGGDERRACIECLHLGAGRRCGNPRAAGLGLDLPRALVELPQRCPGYADYTQLASCSQNDGLSRC